MSRSQFPTAIHEKVHLANADASPFAIVRLPSGWVMAAERQSVEGYCLLFSDPVVTDLNSLDSAQRAQYCLDMVKVGDALLELTGAERINYEIWGNVDPALHAHIVPRYSTEPRDRRVLPICKAYDPQQARPFDLSNEKDSRFREQLRAILLRK